MRNGAKLATITLVLGFAATGFTGVANAGEQLTKKQFLKQANAICETATEGISSAFAAALDSLTPNSQPPPEEAQAALAAAVAGAVPIFRNALAEIEALDGPTAFEKKVDRLLDEYASDLDDVEADPTLAVGEDLFTRPDRRAQRLGLKECIQNPET